MNREKVVDHFVLYGPSIDGNYYRFQQCDRLSWTMLMRLLNPDRQGWPNPGRVFVSLRVKR